MINKIEKINNKLENFLNRNEKYLPYFYSGLVFIIGIILSIFRYPLEDEAIYLRDAMVISERFRNFEWIGNDIFGHGFIFKIPASLIFLISGPNVFLATLTTVIFGSLTAFYLYKLNKIILKTTFWASLATIFTIFSYRFILHTPSYLRDIPGLLVVVLLLYAILLKKNYWILGFLLFLLIEAKEYLFFLFAPPLIVYYFFYDIFKLKINFFKRIITAIYHSFALIFPTVFFIILMFITELIPINYHIVSILGLGYNSNNLVLSILQPEKATKQKYVDKNEDKSNVFDKYLKNNQSPGYKNKGIKKTLPYTYEDSIFILNRKKLITDSSSNIIYSSYYASNDVLSSIINNLDFSINEKSTGSKDLKKSPKQKLKNDYAANNKISKNDELTRNEKAITKTDSLIKKDIDTNLAKRQKPISVDTNSKKTKNKNITASNVKSELKDSTKTIQNEPNLKPSIPEKPLNLKDLKKDIKPQLTGKDDNKTRHKVVNKENKITVEEINISKIRNYSKKKSLEVEHQISSDFISKLKFYSIHSANLLINYISKFFEFRIFTWLSFPKFIIILIFWGSFLFYKEKSLRIFFYIFWFYILVYFFTRSHARYLIHLTPLIALLTIYTFKTIVEERRSIDILITVISLLSLIGLYFEIKFITIQLILILVFVGILIWLNREKSKSSALVFVISFAIVSTGSSLLSSYQSFQIHYFLKYGYCGNYQEVAEKIDRKSVV